MEPSCQLLSLFVVDFVDDLNRVSTLCCYCIIFRGRECQTTYDESIGAERKKQPWLIVR
jgi:hypothetical protein